MLHSASMQRLRADLGRVVCLGGNSLATLADDDERRLRIIHRHEWTWRQEQFAGLDDEDTQGLPADHLPRVDAIAQHARESYWAEILDLLDAIDPAALCEGHAVDYAVYRNQIETLLADQRFRAWQIPFNSDTAFWTNLGFTARRPRRKVEDYQRYLGQLRDVPRYFAEHVTNMRTGLARGFSAPRVTLAGRDQALAAVVTARGESNPFYAPFLKMPASIPPREQAGLRRDALASIAQAVIPAYADLLDFLRHEYLPQARDSIAAEALPDGAAFYRAQIRKYTTLDLTADAIHALGLREVERLHAEMEQTARATGFAGDFAQFQQYLRSEPRFYATSADDLLKQAAWIANRVNGKLDQYFGRLPRRRFVIEAVPEDLAPYYTSGRGGPGYYLVNTCDLPSRPLYALTALTLHEASPGHAFQMPLAAEQADLPDFRRYCHLSAYDEGWALYAERLGVEMGLYDSPYDQFGFLGFQIWRACRLVVDTGIHHLGWSREQARAWLAKHTTLGAHEIETEVDRYISWPAQALSYYLGQTAIVAARSHAQKVLGDRFDLRAFHDTVLALGSVPLPVLQQRIEHFIAAGGPSPQTAARTTS